MNQFVRNMLLAVMVLGTVMLQGCATRVKASLLQNPPPAEAFSSFARIQIKPVVAADGKKINVKAMAKIQQNIEKDMATQLASWNQRPENGRSLVITPVVEELEFTRTASRVFFGPMAGSSGVLLRLQIRDTDGKEIANPEFFQRADAWAAGFVLGVHDNIMLTRIANLASRYVIANFSQAVGGPTGADTRAIN